MPSPSSTVTQFYKVRNTREDLIKLGLSKEFNPVFGDLCLRLSVDPNSEVWDHLSVLDPINKLLLMYAVYPQRLTLEDRVKANNICAYGINGLRTKSSTIVMNSCKSIKDVGTLVNTLPTQGVNKVLVENATITYLRKFSKTSEIEEILKVWCWSVDSDTYSGGSMREIVIMKLQKKMKNNNSLQAHPFCSLRDFKIWKSLDLMWLSMGVRVTNTGIVSRVWGPGSFFYDYDAEDWTPELFGNLVSPYCSIIPVSKEMKDKSRHFTLFTPYPITTLDGTGWTLPAMMLTDEHLQWFKKEIWCRALEVSGLSMNLDDRGYRVLEKTLSYPLIASCNITSKQTIPGIGLYPCESKKLKSSVPDKLYYTLERKWKMPNQNNLLLTYHRVFGCKMYIPGANWKYCDLSILALRKVLHDRDGTKYKNLMKMTRPQILSRVNKV